MIMAIKITAIMLERVIAVIFRARFIELNFLDEYTMRVGILQVWLSYDEGCLKVR